MKGLLYVLLVTTLICCRSSAAQPAQMTVGDLMQLCTSPDVSSKTACSFYILGVVDGASLGTSLVKDKSGAFRDLKEKPLCVPQGLTITAMEFVVRKFMGEDLAFFPEDRDLPAATLIMASIAKQFPCGKPH